MTHFGRTELGSKREGVYIPDEPAEAGTWHSALTDIPNAHNYLDSPLEMSLPLVELIVGHLKEGVTTAHPSFKKLRDACALGGLTKQTYGVAVENPRKLYWVIRASSPLLSSTE